MKHRCLICRIPVPNYRPEYCCTGYDGYDFCGCMGQPLNPCVCSDICKRAVFDYIGLPFEERRIKAGIEKYEED